MKRLASIAIFALALTAWAGQAVGQINVRATEVRGRTIATDDLIVGVATTGSGAAATKSDLLSELIGTIFANSPRGVVTSITSLAVSGSNLVLTYVDADGTTQTATVPVSSLGSGGGALAANSVTAAQARANTEAHRREWQNRLVIPDDWSDIANGTPIALGKVVEHGGAYFGAITAHNKSATGPDGDAANWTLLSSWYGDWVDAWYPAGALVSRGGLPYVASAAVVRGNPAPDASTNTKWLALGVTPPGVVVASSNTSIPATANGNTYIHTGSSNITYTLPAASGGSAVDNGWQVVVSNQGSGDLTIDGAGADTVDRSASLVIDDLGRSVKLQKVANGAWVSIADTKDEVGTGGGGGLTQSQVDARIAALVNDDRILDLAKTTRVTGDRGKFLGVSASNENDLTLLDAPAGGGSSPATWAASGNADRIPPGKLPLVQKIGMTSLSIDPGVVEQQAPATAAQAITRDYALVVSAPDVLSGEDLWIRVFGQGQPLQSGRTKLPVAAAPSWRSTFTINSVTASNIINNDIGGDGINIEVAFYSADSDAALIEQRTVPLDIVQTPRVDDKQPLLPSLGNDQVWLSRGSGVVAGTPPPGPVLIVSNIASYDATQNRFEDSSGTEVVVPNGSIVTTTQAIYDAAVADTGFTPNAAAIFLTR